MKIQQQTVQVPEGKNLNSLLRRFGGHSGIALAVLTACHYVAVTGPSRSGHSPPGSHITELLKRQAGPCIGSFSAVAGTSADVGREILRESCSEQLSCNSAGIRYWWWLVSFTSIGVMRHYRGSLFQLSGQKRRSQQSCPLHQKHSTLLNLRSVHGSPASTLESVCCASQQHDPVMCFLVSQKNSLCFVWFCVFFYRPQSLWEFKV